MRWLFHWVLESTVDNTQVWSFSITSVSYVITDMWSLNWLKWKGSWMNNILLGSQYLDRDYLLTKMKIFTQLSLSLAYSCLWKPFWLRDRETHSILSRSFYSTIFCRSPAAAAAASKTWLCGNVYDYEIIEDFPPSHFMCVDVDDSRRLLLLEKNVYTRFKNVNSWLGRRYQNCITRPIWSVTDDLIICKVRLVKCPIIQSITLHCSLYRESTYIYYYKN